VWGGGGGSVEWVERGEEETEKGEVVGAARHTLQGMGQYLALQLPSYNMPYAPTPFFSPISGPGRQSFEKTGFFAEFLAGNLFCIRICMNVEMYPCILYVIIYTGWVDYTGGTLLSVVSGGRQRYEIIALIFNDYCLKIAKISIKSEKLFTFPVNMARNGAVAEGSYCSLIQALTPCQSAFSVH
jgi:hypothetical protein